MRRLIILRADLILRWKVRHLIERCAKRQTAEALWQLGQQIKEVYLKTMGERDAGYWRRWSSAIGSFGCRNEETLPDRGLSHILAISGLHISVIGMALYRMLKKAGLPFGMAAPCSGRSDVRIRRDGWMGRFRETRGSHVPCCFWEHRSSGGAMIHFVRSHLPQWRFSGKIPCLFWDAGFRFSFVAIPWRRVGRSEHPL